MQVNRRARVLDIDGCFSLRFGRRSCGDVLRILETGNEPAREAARALAVHASSGLLQLGFATADQHPEPAGSRQVTSVRISNLTLPLLTGWC